MRAALSELDQEEKVIIASWLNQVLKDNEFPQWEMDLASERLRLLDEGLSIPAPLEEAVARLDAKWRRS